MAPVHRRKPLRSNNQRNKSARKPKFHQTSENTEPVKDVTIHDEETGTVGEESEQQPSDSEDEKTTASHPYITLLQSLHSEEAVERHQAKRRKITQNGRGEPADREEPSPVYDDDAAPESQTEEVNEPPETEVDDVEDVEDASDPFEVHFATPEQRLTSALTAAKAGRWLHQPLNFNPSGRLRLSRPDDGDTAETSPLPPLTSPDQLKLKKRLVEPCQKVFSQIDGLIKSLAPYVLRYQDLLFAARSVQNASSLRRLTALHILNHVFKTRDRIIKNNTRISRDQDGEEIDARDQGFARPKVLVLLETRQHCFKMVTSLMEFAQPEQQENKKRFEESFFEPETKFSDDRPADFRELFDGNDDNEFRLGIKFTRKTVKLFSPFYASDIILASPLGLRRAVEQSDSKKKDYDFLSSIEIVVVDQADAMLMQNWDHAQFVFDHLNLQPKEAHGCDFSRIRNWYLDGDAKFFRQTIVLSAYLTPELNHLFSTQMHNVAGKLKYQPQHDGSIIEIGLPIKQSFHRYDSASPSSSPDARFKHFTTAILPSVLPRPGTPSNLAPGILVFIPSYLDFVRVRNYFSTSSAALNVSCGAISEYTELSDSRRARSHFLSGRYSVLLYSGRAHHFRRYRIKGVKKVLFYGLPENPGFYRDLAAGFLMSSINEGKVEAGETVVKALFSKWDGLELERIVGTRRAGQMVRDEKGVMFDFV